MMMRYHGFLTTDNHPSFSVLSGHWLTMNTGHHLTWCVQVNTHVMLINSYSSHEELPQQHDNVTSVI